MSTSWAWLDSVVEVRGPTPLLTALEELLGSPVTATPTATVEVEPGTGALERCLQAMNAVVLEQCRSFASHAGVVAQGQRAVAFPGVSGMGKSTLTAACLLRGLDYVSDEALAVEEADLSVRTYARPLGLSPWSLALLGKDALMTGPETAVAHHDLGARAAGATRLAHVVLLRRGNAFDVDLASSGAAAVELLVRSFNHHRDPARAVRVAAGLARSASCWAVVSADPQETAAWICDTLLAD